MVETPPLPSGDDAPLRGALIAQLDAHRQMWDETMLPDFIESVLSIRLTTVQLKVLALVVAEQSGSTVQDLATSLEVSLATMSGVVDRLEGHKMISRTLDPADHRVRRVRATEAGKDVIRALATAQPPGMVEILERMATDDLAALAQGLRALVDAAHAAPCET